MNLNILLRGQSNAYLMGEYNGGAQAMAAKVEALLGFDGINDKVHLKYSSSSDTANTVFSGTSFLQQWLNAQGGNWHHGWTVAELGQSLLNFVDSIPAAQKAEPTAVVWLHSEYDSALSPTPEQWESAVRFDANLVRQAFGQSAASLPYLFVSAIPYAQGTGEGHQAIRTGMEELVADPAFNARIAARALDTDMSFDDLDGDPTTIDYGGAHQSNQDGLQTADRIAFSLAQTWAQYAKPGSPVALAGGAIDDLGPQVVQASQVGSTQVAVKVGFDAAHGLAALDADAAAGIGWTVIGGDGTSSAVDASAAALTGPDTLLLTFGSAIPAGAKLYYGYGYGRLAGADGSGHGNAIYDDQGMPIWVDAHGLTVGGVVAAPPAGSGSAMPPAQFGSAADGWSQSGLVYAGTLDYARSMYQTFGGKAAWGDLAGVQFLPGSWDPNWSTHLAFDNLPMANLNFQAAGARPLDVLLVAAREGGVVLGDGDDRLTWVAHTDGGGDNALVVITGGGNDVLHITSTGYSGLADYNLTDNGNRYDPNYDGHNSAAVLHLGSGADTVTTDGLVKLVVYGDDSNATVTGGGQGDIFLMGSGGGRYTGGGGADTWVFVPGAGHTVITDFASGQDWLTFAGATAADLAITPTTEGGVSGLSITFDAAGHGVFLAGVSALGAGDIMFA